MVHCGSVLLKASYSSLPVGGAASSTSGRWRRSCLIHQPLHLVHIGRGQLILDQVVKDPLGRRPRRLGDEAEREQPVRPVWPQQVGSLLNDLTRHSVGKQLHQVSADTQRVHQLQQLAVMTPLTSL